MVPMSGFSRFLSFLEQGDDRSFRVVLSSLSDSGMSAPFEERSDPFKFSVLSAVYIGCTH